MYCRWMYFCLNIKKFIRLLPAIILETFLFGILLLGIGAYATKAIYSDKVVNKFMVGVVAREEERAAKMLVRFIGSMDSIKDTISFTLLSSEKEAEKKLEAGEICGAILVPEGVIDSVLSGENIPATIWLDNSYSEMETEVFAEFTRAGARLLTTAQAGIYAADAFCREKGWESRIPLTEDYLNEAYFSAAFSRTSLLDKREMEAVKGLNLTDYYTIALLLAFLSFGGLSFGRYVQTKNGEREKLFESRGMGAGGRYFMEAAAFSTVFALLGTVVCVPVLMLVINKSSSFFKPGIAWLLLPAFWFVVGTFLRMLLQLTGSHAGGIGISFVVLMGFMAAAGVFIPSAFLPVWMEKAGRYVPYKIWMESMPVILQGEAQEKTIAAFIPMALLFLAAGAGVAVWKKER